MVYTVLDNQFHTLANLIGRLGVESGNGYNKVGGYQQQKQEYENFLYHLYSVIRRFGVHSYLCRPHPG